MTTSGPRRAITAVGPKRARTLHLVDIENLVGSGRPAVDEVRTTHAAFEQLVAIQEDDLVVIGTGPAAVLPTYLGWAGARYVLRSGPDGADLALLDVIAEENVAERFSAVTIASGDGIFADAAAGLAARGCRVTVVARPNCLSRRLRLTGPVIVYMPTGGMTTPPRDHLDAA